VIGSSGILARGRVCAYGLPCDHHLVFFIFYCNLIRFRPLTSLLTSSSFCPSSAYRESLGHSLFPERPFCPSHPGLPRCPGILGLRAGATSRRPSSGGGAMELSPSPLGGGSRRTRRGPEALPPSSGRPRRGGAAPAFVGASNSSPSTPRVLPWGLGHRSRRPWRPEVP
jgi:hypothetical protein